MAKVRIIKNSLNAGEMSPHMEGRADFARFQNSAATLENFLIHTQGGVSRRWGLRYYATAKVGATAVRLIPFIMSDSDYYLLEFGVGYIRVHRPVGTTGHTTAIDIATTFTGAELFEIDYAQSIDVMYLVHGSHAVQKLSRIDQYGDAWALSDVSFLPAPTYEAELYPAWTIALAAVTGTGVKFYVTATQLLAADIDRVISSGAGRGVIATIDTSLKFGTMDVLEGFASSLIVAGTGTASGAATTITTSVNHGLTAANVGDLILITNGVQIGQSRRIDGVPGVDTLTIDVAFPGNPGGATWNRSAHIDANSWNWLGSPSSKLTSDKTGPVRGLATLTLLTAGFRSTDVGKYVRAMGGMMKITSWTSATEVKAQLMSVLSNAPSTVPYETLAATWTIEEESWSATKGYPQVVSFYEQRLMFGGSTEQPQTLWGSATADFENFAGGNLATDSVEYTIASNETNTFRWMSASRVLLIGALAREYRTSGGGGAITPVAIDIRTETTYGSMKRRPIQIGHSVMFITASGRKVREMVYSFEPDSYKADDLTVLNPEISSGGFAELAYSQEPTSLVFAVRNDGELCVLTYEKSQEVMGWGRWITDGDFESVCVLPKTDDSGEDSIYVVVDRDGGRYIEKFDSDLNTDSAKTGTSATTVSGLGHLEGKTVRMKGDGALYPDAVVVAGAVTFPEAVSIYEVGLNYESTAVTSRPEAAIEGASIQGKTMRWDSIQVRVLDTIGLLVNGERQFVRDTQDLMGSVPQAETGWLEANTLEVDQDGRLTLVQDLPFPATILMVVGDLAVGD